MKVTFDIPEEVAREVQAQSDPDKIAEEALRSWKAYHEWRASRTTPEIEGIVNDALAGSKDLEGLSRAELFDRLEDAAEEIQRQICPE